LEAVAGFQRSRSISRSVSTVRGERLAALRYRSNDFASAGMSPSTLDTGAMALEGGMSREEKYQRGVAQGSAPALGLADAGTLC
jgi:hypothetical protein